MTWEVNDEEFHAVLHQSLDKQLQYFVGHVADWGEVWGLARDGTDWAVMEDKDGGDRRLAVWAHPRYAIACQETMWKDREPTPIEVHEFVDGLVPHVLADDEAFAVMPMADGRYVPAEPRELRSLIEAELSRME